MHIDWGVVFATLVGPILAVWASEYRQRKRQQQDRREWVFRTLMTTRSTRLSLDHVSALNHIDFAFPQDKYPLISDAWGQYLAHLNKPRAENQEGLARWADEGDNLLATLIHQMASSLNVPFPKTSILKSAYHPIGHVDIENQQTEIRKYVLELLKNERALSVTPKP